MFKVDAEEYRSGMFFFTGFEETRKKVAIAEAAKITNRPLLAAARKPRGFTVPFKDKARQFNTKRTSPLWPIKPGSFVLFEPRDVFSEK
jgi:hypothetical protein